MMTTESLSTADLARRARAITAVELATYTGRTQRSQAATERARRSLPMGVPSSFQAYDPHPVVAASATGVLQFSLTLFSTSQSRTGCLSSHGRPR